MRLSLPKSLLWKTLSTIGIISVGFQIFTLTVLAYYIVVPLGKLAADDLSSIMNHAAESWSNLSSEERPDFLGDLIHKHNLVITSADKSLPNLTSLLPYLQFLEDSLTKHQGQAIPLKSSLNEKGIEWIWADIPVTKQVVRIGFERSRISIQPPIALLILLIAGIYITFITAVILARRLTIPVERLYLAAQLIGKGQWPEPIQEDGPKELVVLTRTFNKMNTQVKELLANRTTLLAGIAHDLRTPLTQAQLALAMLPNNGGNLELMESIRDDLDTINNLIGESLSISLELAEENPEKTDVILLLDNVVNHFRLNGADIQWNPGKHCEQMIHPLALNRILTNLLENSIRYGEGKPVHVESKCDKKSLVIQIKDRGPGIPDEEKEAVFLPFYRLEKSRSTKTGGSGLGLAVVRQLANANGWKVQLLERTEGGTNAVLTISIS